MKRCKVCNAVVLKEMDRCLECGRLKTTYIQKRDIMLKKSKAKWLDKIKKSSV